MDPRFAVAGVGADTPLLRAAPAILAEKAAPLFALEERAASGGDMDAIHDMRVASRRLREAMRLLEPLYPRRRFKRWLRRVRRVTRALGPVRDSDVFIDSFAETPAEVGEGGRRAVAFLVGYRLAQREGELAQLRSRLRKLALSQRRSSFAKLACAPCAGPDCLRSLADFAHGAVEQRTDVVFGLLPRALVELDFASQHALRIAVKRLRYAVEVFAPCYEDHFDSLHDTLTRMQDELGDMHDTHVFLEMLHEPERVRAARSAGVESEDLAAVADVLNARAHRLFEEFEATMAKHPEEELRAALLDPLVTESPDLVGAVTEPQAG